MSTKLVKKQLSSIIAETIDKSALAEKQQKLPKTKQKKSKKKTNTNASNPKALKRANLHYLIATAKPSAALQDVLAQALSKRTTTPHP